MATELTNRMLAAAAAACDEKKAEDIRILALDPTESGLTDYFLICNGTNERQNIAIADEIELRLKREFGTYANSVEGRRQAEWILLDYVDFIVHIFSPEKREFYGLERLRKTATSLSVDELNDELKQQITATRKKASTKTAAKKTAPKKAAAKTAVTPTSSKKAVAKKKVTKKAAPAKPAAKKAVVKKVSATKAAVKKTVSKPAAAKAIAKKAVAKKAATKKTAVKRTSR